MKKISALFLALLLICSLLPLAAGAAGVNLARNNDFEKLNDSGNFDNWAAVGGAYGTEILVEKGTGHGGEYAVHLKSGGEVGVVQYATTGQVSGGIEYEIVFWAKTAKDTKAKISFSITWLDESQKGETPAPIEIPLKKGDWTEYKTSVVASDGVNRFGVIYSITGGDVYFDDIIFRRAGVPDTFALPEKNTENIEDTVAGTLIRNASFEEFYENGKADRWSFGGGDYGIEFIAVSDIVRSGGYAMKVEKLASADASIFQYTTKDQIVSGMELEFTMYAYAKEKAMLEITLGQEVFPFPIEKTGEWVEFQKIITAPEDTPERVVTSIVVKEGGAVYLDDINLAKPVEELPLLTNPGEKDLVVNGGFENGFEGYPHVFEGFDSGREVIDDKIFYSGEKSLRINGKGWACQTITHVQPGATYQMTTMYRTEQCSGNVLFKIEAYDVDGNYLSLYSRHSTGFVKAEKEWKQGTAVVDTPWNVGYVKVYVRLLTSADNAGTVWFDDFAMWKIADPTYLHIEPHAVFFYPDYTENDYADITVNTRHYPEALDFTVDVHLTKDGKALYSSTGNAVTEGGMIRFTYDTGLMTEKQVPYYIEANIRDSAGNIVSTEKLDVYRYDRPEYLGIDGIFNDGTGEFIPQFAYHVMNKNDWKHFNDEMGINVFQAAATKENLDYAAEIGVKLLLVLYNNMKPAGNPDNLENTIKKVTEFKDHPGVFGWMIMDEPYVYMADPAGDSWLQTSYRTIRDIDPKHPTFIVEAGVEHFEKSARYADILSIDRYIVSANELNAPTKSVSGMNLCVGGYKPVYSLMMGGAVASDPAPYTESMRNHMWQSFYAGATVVGWYTNEVDTFQMEWAEHHAEYEDAYRHFILHDYPIFCDKNGGNYYYRGFVKDDAIYLVVLSVGTDAPSYDVTVDLTSTGGDVVLDGFTAELLAGGAYPTIALDGAGDANQVLNQGGTSEKTDAITIGGTYTHTKESYTGHTMDVIVGSSNALLYKITPNTPISTDTLINESRFKDLVKYDWARHAITVLDEKGIVNQKGGYLAYRPELAITRGELAMFLVRTLGLTGNATDSFADVAPDAEYAKEIAIGKANGILQGVGDNKFNPEAEITRQDLMTMIGRGLALAGEADLAAFSDSGLIADYALSHVKSMIASGLIRGNADGTLNPLGNTTRAEAAVIMERILSR